MSDNPLYNVLRGPCFGAQTDKGMPERMKALYNDSVRVLFADAPRLYRVNFRFTVHGQ